MDFHALNISPPAPATTAATDNLAQAIYRHACATPDAPALVCEGVTLSYGAFARRAAALADSLLRHPAWPATAAATATSAAAAPPRVGLFASRSIDACVALIGSCWAGATYVPIGLKQPEERILAVLRQCDLAAVVCDAAGAALLTPRVRAACPPLVLPADAVAMTAASDGAVAELTPPRPLARAATAYIIFTSGTTGTPKGVMIPLAAVRHYLDTIVPWLGLQASDRALETCELSFDFSVHNLFSTWEAGAALHILPATRVMNAHRFVREAGLTVWNSVPSLAGMLRQLKALSPDSLPSLRLTVFGGEQLPAAAVEAWRQAAPASAIVNLYGPTEATVFCLAQRVVDATAPLPTADETPSPSALPLTPGRDVVAIGTPLPGSRACVVDAADQPVPPGTAGELLLGGVQLASGYLGAAELSAQRFPLLDGERWYRSGDLALCDAAGRFHCLGRIDNQVKVLGYRVELEEIDAHLRRAAGVDLVGAVAWPVVDGMARGVVGFVGAATPMAPIDANSIIATLQAKLPPYMTPQRIIALEQMPVNSSGKVDRRALGQILADENSLRTTG